MNGPSHLDLNFLGNSLNLELYSKTFWLGVMLEIVKHAVEEIIIVIKLFYNFHQGSMRKNHKSVVEVYTFSTINLLTATI